MDVFYFGGRPQSAPQKDGSDLKWRSKPSAKRPRVCSTMDTSPYYAAVVRIAEPVLPAYNFSLASNHLDSLINAGYWPSSLIHPPPGPEEQTVDRLPTPKPDERPYDTVRSSVRNASVPLTGRMLARPEHPRPESSDLLEEEDGRRIRFALPSESDDHVERLRNAVAARVHEDQRGGSAPEHESRTTDREDYRYVQDISPEIGVSTAFNPPLHHDLGSSGLQQGILSPPAPIFSLQTASQLLLDETFLAVDDHRRSYDFGDFMDRWRLKACHDAGLPSFKTAIGPLLWRKPQRDHVRLDTGSGKDDQRDCQGLAWEAFGVDRESALRARTLLHPQGAAGNPHRAPRLNDNNGLHYTPRAFMPAHRANFSHYQLRNMSVIGNGRKVYYALGSKVEMASLSCPSSKRTAIDLAKRSHSATPFKITCLASSRSNERSSQDDILVAGGFNGEYAILDLDAPKNTKPLEGVVSHARDGIVNHIESFYGRTSGSLQAAFCSNDQRVRIMDIRREAFTNTFDYDSAINCSAMSPDGRLRALVHDGSDAWITNAETGGILVNLEAHTDHAFACDWSPCGRYVATGAEDRQVVIWDSRNWSRPLHKLECVMSCARSLHFKVDGTLVIAESEDVVSVVDTRNSGLRQDIRFFGAITGLSFVNGGEEMVVANADQTVGGLMSFRRVARDQGYGAFGERVCLDHGSKRRRRYEASVVEDVLI